MIDILEKLSDSDGVSGNEDEVRDFIIHEIYPFADKIEVDALGNVIAFKKGEKSGKRIMLSAHMDEVGFIVTDITDSGYIKFDEVGGIDPRVLISKRVTIGKNKVRGVIALKAVHLQTKEERENAKKISDLSVDIGAKDKTDAERLVSVGDYISFDTKFSKMGKNACKGKALDDRVGCAAIISAIKEKNKYDTWYCFTVQEEVGCRGSACAARKVKPDYALVIEGTTCSDVSGVSPYLEVTTLGGGAAFSIMDRGSYSDREYTDYLYESAKSAGIKVQYKRTTMGANDARSIQVSASGCRTAAVSVPVRYLHSPVSIISESDFEAVCSIAKMAVLLD